jgi:hypothetical protein
MAEPLIVHRYWVTDESTGIRRLTSQHLSTQDAAQRHPGAVAEPTSRERRWLSEDARSEQPDPQ